MKGVLFVAVLAAGADVGESAVTETNTTSTTSRTTTTATTTTYSCTNTKQGETQVLCKSLDQCIPESYLCDGGDADCDDASDEKDCPTSGPIECLEPWSSDLSDSGKYFLYVPVGEVQCNAVVDALNSFEGVVEMYCSSGRLRFATSTACDGPKDELNKFADVELNCYGTELYVEEGGRCRNTVAALNGILARKETDCSDHSTFQAVDGRCPCHEGFIGKDWLKHEDYVASLLEQNHCAFSDGTSCSSAGTVDVTGSCACDGPETGLGRTCSEFNNAKDCNSAGIVKLTGVRGVNETGTCTCDEGFFGAACYSDNSTCSFAGIVNISTGRCTCDIDKGFIGTKCDKLDILAECDQPLISNASYQSSECAGGLVCEDVRGVNKCISGPCDPTLPRNSECGKGLVCTNVSNTCVSDRASAIANDVGAATIGAIIVGILVPMLV
jgi:hypothetical protein